MNIRQKGFNAEREVATLLNAGVMTAMRRQGYPEDDVVKAATTVQRNQNQSAVGGSDLTNTLGLAIEVKRHENTSGINGWWAQCTAAAKRNNEIPVLIYRQSRSPWRVQMPVVIQLTPTLMHAEPEDPRFPGGPSIAKEVPGRTFQIPRAEIGWSEFYEFWIQHVQIALAQGTLIRT